MKKLVFSSGVAGLFPTPKAVRDCYGEAGEAVGNKMLIELICWKHIYKWFSKTALKQNCQVVGWHGPIGFWTKGSRSVLETGVDVMLAGWKELIRGARESGVEYVLMHENVIDERLLECGIEGLEEVKLMLENKPEKGSMATAVEKAGLLGSGTGVMVDLVHLLYEQEGYAYDMDKSSFRRAWDRSLKNIDKLSGLAVGRIGFHIPIGKREDDSLPLGLMEEGMWKDLFWLVNKLRRVEYLVLENEQPMIDQLVPIWIKGPGGISGRNESIVERLVEWGIIE